MTDETMNPLAWQARRSRLHDEGLRKAAAKLWDVAASAVCKIPDLGPAKALVKRNRRPKVVEDPLLKAEWASMLSPRVGNTGAESTGNEGLFKQARVCNHHLRVSFSSEHRQAVRDRVSELLGEADDELPGFWSYRDSCKWSEGARLHWTEGRGEACLDINGRTLDLMKPEDHLSLVWFLDDLGARGRRIDFAFDDYQRVASIDLVRANAKAGNFTGFKRIDGHEPMNPFSGEKSGDSVEFGRRGNEGSGLFLRVYDKFLESGCDPNLDCIRWEVELCNERAQAAFKLMATCRNTAELAKLMSTTIAGSIDFKLRTGYEANVSRAPRLSWWQRILDLLGGQLAIKNADYRTSLSRALATAKRQYGRLFALARIVSNSIGLNFPAVVDAWCDGFEPKINWAKQARRDLRIDVPLLLAT